MTHQTTGMADPSPNTRRPVWLMSKPPNEVLVEAEDADGQVHRVSAFWGRDGYRPHWRSEDGNTHYDPSYFGRWRRIHG